MTRIETLRRLQDRDPGWDWPAILDLINDAGLVVVRPPIHLSDEAEELLKTAPPFPGPYGGRNHHYGETPGYCQTHDSYACPRPGAPLAGQVFADVQDPFPETRPPEPGDPLGDALMSAFAAWVHALRTCADRPDPTTETPR